MSEKDDTCFSFSIISTVYHLVSARLIIWTIYKLRIIKLLASSSYIRVYLFSIPMKNYVKHIRFEDIVVKVESQHPKDISRVVFKIIQESHQQHKTKNYGEVHPNQIAWSSPIQFKYQAQRIFNFETNCEHEYGYEVKELEALYSGEIKIKPQDFFHTNSFPVFKLGSDNKRVKCGKVSFIVKVVDREVGIKVDTDQQVQNKDRIKVDLIGRLIIKEAILSINASYVPEYENKKFRNYKFQVKIDATYMDGRFKENYKWEFREGRAELIIKSDKAIRFRLIDPSKQDQEDSIILEGKLPISTLLKNKRFLTHSVQMHNPNKRTRVGVLSVDMRLMEKKQILDLMYSPKKLEEIKMQDVNYSLEDSRVVRASHQSLAEIPKIGKMAVSRHNYGRQRSSMDMSARGKNLLGQDLSIEPQNSPSKMKQSRDLSGKKQKYDIYFRSRYQDHKFSQSKRFKDRMPNNPFVSYLGPDSLSEFSPKAKRKEKDFTTTDKVDFTKGLRHNPGVGDYNLPSIWQRI